MTNMSDMNMQGEGGTSMVSRCDATSCRYNSDQQCHAGQIEVSMSGQMAQCLTYSPEDGMGAGMGRGEGAS